MKARKILDPIGTDPLIAELETAVRIRVRIDVRRLVGVNSHAGEPGPEELEGYVLAILERFLQGQVYIVDAHVNWLDVEYPVPRLLGEYPW